MNANVVTTGLVPLSVGSVERFRLRGVLNGLEWDFTGGSVTLTLRDPTGAQTAIAADVQGYAADARWTAAGPVGTWTRSWTVVDANGVKQVGTPIVFQVAASP